MKGALAKKKKKKKEKLSSSKKKKIRLYQKKKVAVLLAFFNILHSKRKEYTQSQIVRESGNSDFPNIIQISLKFDCVMQNL